MFLKSWEQKEKIFRYLWGVEKEENTNSINEYLEKYKRLFMMAIIWYLDYDIMIKMQK